MWVTGGGSEGDQTFIGKLRDWRVWSLESGESTVYNFGAEITDVETSHALLTIQKQYLNQHLN